MYHNDLFLYFGFLATILGILVLIKIIDFIVVSICFSIILKKHYNESAWIAIVPIYNYYIFAKHTFGEKYAWIGAVVAFFGIFSGSGTLMYLAVTLVSGWFLYSVYSRIDSREQSFLWILAAVIPFIFLPVLLLTSDLKYKGPKLPFFIKE